MIPPSALTAFSLSSPPAEGAGRDRVIAWARGEIARVREWVAQSNALGRGTAVCEAHSDALSDVIRHLFRWVEASTGGGPTRGLAVVAQGGFGRRRMALHSDIDLLLLVDSQLTEALEDRIRALVQLLWDTGEETGHSVKSVKEALATVGEDVISMTALFESRTLAGDESLWLELERGLRQRLERGAVSEYLRQRIEEMRGRHARFGNTVYLLEPNLKEGEGGLRDIHMCQWVSYACLGTCDLTALVEAEVLTAENLVELNEAWDFLLAVRNALHAVAGRRIDTLDFERVRPVAQALGIGPNEVHSLAEEHLIHLCHVHGRVVDRAAQRVARLLPRRTSLAGRMTRRLRERHLRGGWVSRDGEIALGSSMPADLFSSDPGQMLEICAVARERGLRLSDEVCEAIHRECRRGCEEALQTDPSTTERLLRIFRGPAHTARTVRQMADTGLLGEVLPPWRRIQSMVRIDHFHRYTVDEHTLKCLESAEALLTGQLDEREPGLVEAAHQVERWDLLMLGILLHDIGKGEGRGHVVKGGQIAQRVAQRLGLDNEEARTLRELVLGHLWIPHLAFRRDATDPSVIDRLAHQVGNLDLLHMLFILTFADISGVRPDHWTAWKGQLIWALVTGTRRRLEGVDSDDFEVGPDLEHLTEQVLARLSEDSEAIRQRARDLVRSGSDRYLRSVTPRRMADHARLLARLSDQTRAVWQVEHPPRCNYSEITVAVVDEPGVFGLMCGALASKEINILSAQAYSTDDGFAVEIFQVTTARGEALPEGFVLTRVEREVNRVLRGESREEEVFPVRLSPPTAGPELLALAPTVIEFDNSASSHCTVMELRTADRRGLLHALTHQLAIHGAMIYLAMISTEAYRVVDVFYLTDLDNMKIDDPKRLTELERGIREMLDSPSEH
ncbi:[protein-PII] uridylyltransferase [Candidatus Sumerlaeota bacterium]|nr:[protein-PII] uridylyltransferase [Candidatus Sumerlaeota bacterium]